MPSLTVVIPTRNRSSSLRETLSCVAAVKVPAGWSASLIVVDNASTDDTAEVAATGSLGGRSAEVVYEERLGVARARNRGAEHGGGDILLFLDDDVHPPDNWIVDLASPIVERDVAATVSLFRAGPSLDLPWMNDDDRAALVTERSLAPSDPWLCAACMAIRREVFDGFGGFEEELGPGAIGSGGEDILLGRRLTDADLAVECVPSVVAVHWFDVSKLSKKRLAERHAAGARSEAWISYHWFGEFDRFARIKALLAQLVRDPVRAAWHAQMATEQQRPRKFERNDPSTRPRNS